MLIKLNSLIWGKGLICLLIFTGIIYTVKLRFIQFRLFPYLFRKIRRSGSKSKQFRTFCISLGTAMGTGNITGVASAIRIGGAGAVFWMWFSAFTGMAVVYAENSLSAKYSRKNIRGPMAYIRYGTGTERISVFFAVCCVLASFGMGGMVQVNEIAVNIRRCADINAIIMFFAVLTLIYLVISGGVKRICDISQFLLPVAALVYMILCLCAIARSHSRISGTLHSIFAEAFGIKQAAGGVSGYCISQAVSAGIRRGVFSNEAGLGSSPILHSSSENYASSEVQGMCSMLEVFTDTFLCCTLTAMAVLCSGGDQSVYSSFWPVTGDKTGIILAVLTAVFAFCTVIGWSYCGLTAFNYIFGDKGKIFTLLFAVVSACGALFRSGTVWTISDIFNGLMAFSNVFALLYLVKDVKAE